jgi:hypothetical protein
VSSWWTECPLFKKIAQKPVKNLAENVHYLDKFLYERCRGIVDKHLLFQTV